MTIRRMLFAAACAAIAASSVAVAQDSRDGKGDRKISPDAQGGPVEQSGIARRRPRRGIVDDAARPEERHRSSSATSARVRARWTAPSPNCRAISPMPTASWTLETRILWCMEKLQGFNPADLVKRPHPGGGQPVKELGAMATYVASKSAGRNSPPSSIKPRKRMRSRSARRCSIRRSGAVRFRLRDLP